MRHYSAVEESNSQPIVPKFDTNSRCAIYKSSITITANPQFVAANLAPPSRNLAAPAIQTKNRYVRSMCLHYFQRYATRKGSYKRAEGLASASLFYIVYSNHFVFDNITQCC